MTLASGATSDSLPKVVTTSAHVAIWHVSEATRDARTYLRAFEADGRSDRGTSRMSR